jgi:alpha-tubulin suppressor-like RCC1 family protein
MATANYSHTQYTGIWTLQQVHDAIAAGTWPVVGPALYVWGANDVGVLGLGDTVNRSLPTQLGTVGAVNWSSISGYYSAVAVKTDGTLWSWGNNDSGALGLGNLTNYSSPKQIGTLNTWYTVAGGRYNAFAIKTDGTLWAWGLNNQGQLGLGNRTNYSSPKQVGALTTWLKVSAGQYHTGAIKTDGTLWMWGEGGSGRLGLSNTTDYSSPKQVGSLTNWLHLSCGTYNTTTIKTDGTMWSWGSNVSYGELGLNNRTSYSSPKQIGALTTWAHVSNAGQSVVAIKTDGTMWSWGLNNHGQLGQGNLTHYSSPKQVGALTTWTTQAIGGSVFSRAIKTDGTLWSWGLNSSGYLGLGNTTSYSSPKQVGSLTTWLTLSTTYNYAAAIATKG